MFFNHKTSPDHLYIQTTNTLALTYDHTQNSATDTLSLSTVQTYNSASDSAGLPSVGPTYTNNKYTLFNN